MDKTDKVFSEEYAVESSTDFPKENTEEKRQDQTVAGETGYQDKSKPHRVVIRAREIEE